MQFEAGRTWLGRVPQGEDLWEWLRQFAWRRGIYAGGISVIGAVSRAVISFYDQKKQSYENRILEGPHEIVSCQGNISIYEEKPFPHLHIVLADRTGKCQGGHLQAGTVVFMAEYEIRELSGAELKRSPDEETGLPLWRSGDY
jgi:predicted DNA-binding protein with PD1-like motif